MYLSINVLMSLYFPTLSEICVYVNNLIMFQTKAFMQLAK